MKLLIVLLLFVPTFLFSQEHYLIKGKVGEYGAPAKMYLRYYIGEEFNIDSAEMDFGNFTFKGTVPSAVKAVLIFSSDGKNYKELINPDFGDIFLAHGVINVNGSSWKEAIVTGNSINEEFQAYKRIVKRYDNAVRMISDEYRNASDEKKKI